MAEICLGEDDNQHKIIRRNTTDKDLSKLMEEIKTELYVNKSQGLKTLVKIYYAGHGAMKNMTYCVTTAPGRQFYPLENMLINLSKTENAFIFAIFDCCRDELKE